MRTVRVLLTATGGLAGYSHRNLLAKVSGYKVELVPADIADCHNYNTFMGEPVHLIPRGDAPAFADTLLSLCLKEKVDVVFPCSSNEVVPMSKAKSLFQSAGIVVAVADDPVSLETAVDKLNVYEWMKKSPRLAAFIPHYVCLGSRADLRAGAQELGYPQNEIVFKLRRSQGGRGVFRLAENAGDLFRIKSNVPLRLDWLESVLSENLNDGFLMDHLPGKEYSVDVLAHGGEAKTVIPRERAAVVDGKAVLSKLVYQKEIIECTEELTRIFNLSYLANLQFKEDDNGQPKLLEINPRVPGTLAADLAGGVNMFQETLDLIYRGDVTIKAVRWGAECGRFFQELYR